MAVLTLYNALSMVVNALSEVCRQHTRLPSELPFPVAVAPLKATATGRVAADEADTTCVRAASATAASATAASATAASATAASATAITHKATRAATALATVPICAQRADSTAMPVATVGLHAAAATTESTPKVAGAASASAAKGPSASGRSPRARGAGVKQRWPPSPPASPPAHPGPCGNGGNGTVQAAVSADYELLPENGDDETAQSESDDPGAEAQLEDDLTPDDVAEIYAFMRKASSPAVGLYPRAVEEYVMLHAHEISNEERWRAGLSEQIGNVASQIRTFVKLGKAGKAKDAPLESSTVPAASEQCTDHTLSKAGAMNDISIQMGRSLRAMEERMAKSEDMLQTLLVELRQLRSDRTQPGDMPGDRRAVPATSAAPAAFDA